MEFEWDERKRAQIVAERALDFVAAYRFFDGRPASHQPTPRGGEERWKTTAIIEGEHVTLVWCWRGEKIRVITMRRAHEQEIGTYRKLHGG
jgi:uncharacterized protein